MSGFFGTAARFIAGRKKIWIPALILIVVIVIAVRSGVWKNSQGRGKQTAPVPVMAAPVTRADIGVYLSGLGTVTPLKTVTVKSRVDGQIMRILFTEGQQVREGDLLAEIDPRPYQAQLAQAEGILAKDQALVTNAQIDLERYKTLYAQEAIAQQQLATQESLVRQYTAALKADQAQVDMARLQLTYARVTSPISGRAGLRLVDQGNIVRAGDATGIVVITQHQPITVIFTIPEDSLPLLLAQTSAGRTLTVEASDRAQQKKLASGVLAAVDNQVDLSTGTVKLKAQFSNMDGRLFPNQFVNVKMLVDTHKNVVVAPLAAIQRGPQGMFAYVVNADQTASLRLVKGAADDGKNVEIESGLAPGESVVIDGVDRIREGSLLQLPDASPSPKQPEKQTDGPGQRNKRHPDKGK